jgi:hypothetical protein
VKLDDDGPQNEEKPNFEVKSNENEPEGDKIESLIAIVGATEEQCCHGLAEGGYIQQF